MGNGTRLWSNHDGDRSSPFCCWPECGNRLKADRETPLCGVHFIKAGGEFVREAKIGLMDPLFTATTSDEEIVARAERQKAADAAKQARSVVYYVRIGRHIKIGTTTNLLARFQSFHVEDEALLATEPGSYELEKQRHTEFADERIGRREMFTPTLRLIAHIDAVRAEHGDPELRAA